jgi:hypothetical protein
MKRVVSKLMAGKPATAGQLQRETRELHRLETLIDSVFALVIVLIVFDPPEPDNAEAFELASYVAFRLDPLVTTTLAVLVYWFQSNLLLGNFSHTDGKHALMSLLQVFLVLASTDRFLETDIVAVQRHAAGLVENAFQQQRGDIHARIVNGHQRNMVH